MSLALDWIGIDIRLKSRHAGHYYVKFTRLKFAVINIRNYLLAVLTRRNVNA